jgi:hypothetical protein
MTEAVSPSVSATLRGATSQKTLFFLIEFKLRFYIMDLDSLDEMALT